MGQGQGPEQPCQFCSGPSLPSTSPRCGLRKLPARRGVGACLLQGALAAAVHTVCTMRVETIFGKSFSRTKLAVRTKGHRSRDDPTGFLL